MRLVSAMWADFYPFDNMLPEAQGNIGTRIRMIFGKGISSLSGEVVILARLCTGKRYRISLALEKSLDTGILSSGRS